jgi:ATP-dependent DNA helicase RecQ
MNTARGVTVAQARDAMRRVFGHEDFRPGQEDALAALLAGEDVLAVMPTGAGKSLLYQLPAIAGAGPVVVVSPLISLMRDQVAALRAKGVAAGALHSAADPDETARVADMIGQRRVALLYLAPERLTQPGTRDMLLRLRARLLAIDEAHCVSRWADDFRPDYAAIADIATALGQPQIVAVTATAGPRTRDDVVARLFHRSPRIFVRSFARPNIAISFRRRSNTGIDVAGIVAKRHGASGIVYCASRAATDHLAAALAARGIPAMAYHAGLDSGTREAHQDRFMRESGAVMVATIAFGMGIDKKDIRFVCHADLPHSVEAYYQEIGRAGRDGLAAEAIGLVDPRLVAAQHRLPPDARAMIALTQRPACRWQGLLAALGEQGPRCATCDLCARDPLFVRRTALAASSAWTSARSRAAHFFTAGISDATQDDEREAGEDRNSHMQEKHDARNVDQERRLTRLLAERARFARQAQRPPVHIASEAELHALAALDPSNDPHWGGTGPPASCATLPDGTAFCRRWMRKGLSRVPRTSPSGIRPLAVLAHNLAVLAEHRGPHGHPA